MELSSTEITTRLNEISWLLKQKYEIAYSLVNKELWADRDKHLKELYQRKENCYIWIVDENVKSYRTIDYDGAVVNYIRCYEETKQCFELAINQQLQEILLSENK